LPAAPRFPLSAFRAFFERSVVPNDPLMTCGDPTLFFGMLSAA
jgi:hypothetical protein